MKYRGLKYFFLNLVTSIFVVAPVLNFAQSDQQFLTIEQFIQNVKDFHPDVRRANLQIDYARYELLKARGALDPMISSSFNQKQFDDKLYYQHFDAGLVLPTRLGLDLKTGYEQNDGLFLNPEQSTDQFGLFHFGAELEVLQGFLNNSKNIGLKQANLYQDIALNQREAAINSILLEAYLYYIEWQKFYYSQEVMVENLTLSEEYLNSTKISFLNGEKSAIDTLEASIMYFDAQFFSSTLDAELVKSRFKLQEFYWDTDGPSKLPEVSIPDSVNEAIMPINQFAINSQALESNPFVDEKTQKIRYQELQQRFNRDKLKPKLKAKYNYLLSTDENSLRPSFSPNNYNWGVSFQMPLLFRSERAKVQQGEIAIQELTLERDEKQNEIINRRNSSLQQIRILQDQIDQVSSNVENYKLLLEGENTKFLFGESSVFLLNKRQEKYIGGKLKLVELWSKYQKELVYYSFYNNTINN